MDSQCNERLFCCNVNFVAHAHSLLMAWRLRCAFLVCNLAFLQALIVAWSAFLHAVQFLSKHNIMRKASMRAWMEQQRNQLWELVSFSEEDREELRRLDESSFLQ